MAVLVNKDFQFIVQGITGREALNFTRECLEYGSKIVGGVTPGKGGRDVYGVPGLRHRARDHGQTAGRRHGDHRALGVHRRRGFRGDRRRHQAARDHHRRHAAQGRDADRRVRRRATAPA